MFSSILSSTMQHIRQDDR
uniref:Uncharacterized protein n=1 Tax=Arundo donax TaxID=35708 RepID=A0A0A9BGN8_ARUDO